MTAYWDTSALVQAIVDPGNASWAASHERITRSHALAESFSTLTGGRMRDAHGFRVQLTGADAARAIRALFSQVRIVSLNDSQILEALDDAQGLGVRGGGIHDLMHARAAELHNAEKIYTLNLKHFSPITSLQVLPP